MLIDARRDRNPEPDLDQRAQAAYEAGPSGGGIPPYVQPWGELSPVIREMWREYVRRDGRMPGR